MVPCIDDNKNAMATDSTILHVESRHPRSQLIGCIGSPSCYVVLIYLKSKEMRFFWWLYLDPKAIGRHACSCV